MPSKQTTTKPRRLVVTPRRRAVLEGLHTYKLLREAAIHRLYFSAIKEGRNVHDKLKGYRDQKLIGYIPMPFFPGSDEGARTFTHQDRRDNFYYLGKRGADLLDVPYDDRYEQMDFSHLYHRIDIQEFRLALELALRATPHTTLAHWINEHDHDENKKALLYYKTQAVDPATKKKLSLRPDAAFILHDSQTDKEDFFFLEIDEGREDLADRWKKKILAYRAYAASDFSHDWQFNGKGFRVLTINRSQTDKEPEKRKANLITAVRSWGGKKQFYFTTFKDLMPDDQVTGDHFLTSPIWQRAEADDPDACPSLKLIDYLFDRDKK